MSNYSNYGSYGSYYTSSDTSSIAGLAAMSGGTMLISFAISILAIVSMWKIFTKAGEQGWKAIIPIYNFYTLIKIAGLPGWYLVLMIVPIANIYVIFKTYIELAHKFGKTTGFGVLMVFFGVILLPVLAFGKDQYQGTTNNFNQPMNNNMNQNNFNQPMNNNMNQNNFNQPMNNGMNQNSFNQPMNNMPNPTIQPMENQNNQSISNFTQNAQPVQQQNTKFCPNCGAQVASTANNCPMCGSKLN